jgi:hypothetical protein
MAMVDDVMTLTGGNNETNSILCSVTGILAFGRLLYSCLALFKVSVH